MKKIKEHILNNILSYTILYILIITSFHLILSLNELMFRNWIVYISTIVIVIGLTTGIIQLALKAKKKAIKYIIVVLFVIIPLIISPYIYFFLRVAGRSLPTRIYC